MTTAMCRKSKSWQEQLESKKKIAGYNQVFLRDNKVTMILKSFKK